MSEGPMVGGVRAAPEAGRRAIDRWLRLASPLLLAVAAAAAALVFMDYGITWDEGVQSTYGELVLDYFVSDILFIIME